MRFQPYLYSISDIQCSVEVLYTDHFYMWYTVLHLSTLPVWGFLLFLKLVIQGFKFLF